MRILISGTAGFIGYHLVKNLENEDVEILGIDNINDYYDINLKYARLENSGISVNELLYNRVIKSRTLNNYEFVELDLSDTEKILKLISDWSPDVICNLAAQAGVRYSLENPFAYIKSNIDGFLNILEGARNCDVKHLLFASSSSVYGLNKKMPFSTSDNVDHPVSLYAASKKSDELMAHSYSYLYGIPISGLRFFTVYGPWGRPDMALFKFTKNIFEGKPIDVYNNGNMSRDFTYIGDIITGIKRLLKSPAQPNSDWSGENPDPSSSLAPYKIYNIGNGSPVGLMKFIETLEEIIGKKSEKRLMPMQPGDVVSTWADTSALEKVTGYSPGTPLKDGVKKFVNWYKEFYKIS